MRRGARNQLQSAHVPAPLGGVNLVDSLSAMPPTDCPYIYNAIPGEHGMAIRPGFAEWATGLAGGEDLTVRTTIGFTGSARNGTGNRLFAVTAAGIYDITASVENPVLSVVFDVNDEEAGYGSAVAMETVAGKFLLYCDEENGLYIYTESTDTWAKVSGDTTQAWAASTSYEVGDLVVASGNVYLCDTDGVSDSTTAPSGSGTNIVDGTTRWDYVGAAASSVIGPSLADQRLGYGADPADFVFVTVWKERVWLVERNSTRGWYLDAKSIYGTATSFNFGAKFQKGGPLVGLWSWSYDGGSGLDTSLVAISQAGDIAVWLGTDPASASTFSIKGVWYAGGVVSGRRIANDSGGDLLVISSLGLVPLSRLVVGGEELDRTSYASYKIGPLFSRLTQQFGSYRSWAVLAHPTANCLLVLVPSSGNGDATTQLALSFSTKGWFFWRDLPITSACAWNGELYFGTHDGRVCRQTGNIDDVDISNSYSFDEVAYSGLLAFQNLGNANNKQVSLVRPVIHSDTPLATMQCTARYDYNLDEPSAPTGSSEVDLPEGHDSSEDGDANALVVYRFDDLTSLSATPGEPDGPGYGLSATGSVSESAGRINGALWLNNDGVSSGGARLYTDTPATVAAFRSLFNGAAWTWEGWVKYGTMAGIRAAIFDLGIRAAIGFPLIRLEILDATPNLTFEVSSGGASFALRDAATETTTYAISAATLLDTWHHFALRESSGRTDLLINGVKVATRGSTVVDSAGVDRWAIGAAADSAADRAFNGYVDDFAFYSDARSDAEILADYQRGTVAARAGADGFDEAVWDTATWGGALGVSRPLSGASGMGRAVSVAFRGNARSRTVLTGFDILFRQGGLLP